MNSTGGTTGTTARTRIVIVGGGFAGLNTARWLERWCRREPAVDVVLVSRNNHFLMTPLLFHAGVGVLGYRHVISPIRPLLRRARFIEGNLERVDFDGRTAVVRIGPDETVGVPYDHLVLALGGVSNTRLIPGAEHALGFKTLIDAVILRNHVIDRLERAAAEPHPDHRRALLTFAVVGGGLLGVELLGELTGFVRDLSAWYPHVQPDVRYELIESDPKVLSELDPRLADYAVRVLTGRGVRIRTGSRVRQIEPGRLHLPGGETLRAGTIVAATGVLPNPLLATFPLEKDRKGRVVVDPTLRTSRPEVWALGDCAAIPAPDGGTYPARAQHASRQAKVLADNLHGTLTGRPPRPFRFHTLGTLATLGRRQGVGQVMGWRLRGFPAWLLWRAYYLTRMPQWERRLRILIDWTLASLFRADTVKVDLEDEKQVLQRFGQWFELGPSSRPDAEGATHEEGVLTGPARGT